MSLGFPRQEYLKGSLFLPPGDLPDPGIKPTSPVAPASSGGFFTSEPPRKPHLTPKRHKHVGGFSLVFSTFTVESQDLTDYWGHSGYSTNIA